LDLHTSPQTITLLNYDVAEITRHHAHNNKMSTSLFIAVELKTRGPQSQVNDDVDVDVEEIRAQTNNCLYARS